MSKVKHYKLKNIVVWKEDCGCYCTADGVAHIANCAKHLEVYILKEKVT